MSNIAQLIEEIPKDDKQKAIEYLEKYMNKIEEIKTLNYINKKDIYDVFEKVVFELRDKFFSFKNINDIEPVFQVLINLHINLLIDLKKPGIENYFVIFKGTGKYRILKALSKFRFVENINKLSEYLLDNADKVFNYLYKAYEIEEDDELIFKIFKQFVSRLFSAPEYVSEGARKEIIQYLLQGNNFKFFYGIEKYKKYIESSIVDEVLSEEDIKQEAEKEEIDLSDLRIGLIFGSPHSVKSFKKYKKKDKSLKFIEELGLTDFDTNFEILETDFEKQKNLKASRLIDRFLGIGDRLDLILAFEVDHRTQFYDRLLNDPDFSWRIVVNSKENTDSNQSGQHFSNSKFEKMLKKGIERYIINISGSLNLDKNGQKASIRNNIDFDINWRERHRIVSNSFEGYFIDYYTNEKGEYTSLGQLVHSIKYDSLSQEEINQRIKEILKYIPDVKKLFGIIDLIIPVPPSLDRNIQLVYVLSQKIAEKFDIPIYDDVLIKNRNTKSLKNLPENERVEEINGAFSIKNEKLVNGKNVLVFDDIYDSGTTINEICEVLKNEGKIDKIYVLTLTKTRKEYALSR